jgi:methylmalonyl-CoA mutase
METAIYRANNPIRFVTATSLFDGHDVSINIMRRLLQDSGVEVVHLGHNRSADEIVTAAIHEDVQGIAVSSYQGGHLEFFKYIHDLLRERGAGHIRVFGGGGGVIIPDEIEELHGYGICKIFSPEDGRKMGLQGMINFKLRSCDFPTPRQLADDLARLGAHCHQAIARLITMAEASLPQRSPQEAALLEKIRRAASPPTAAFSRGDTAIARLFGCVAELSRHRIGVSTTGSASIKPPCQIATATLIQNSRFAQR